MTNKIRLGSLLTKKEMVFIALFFLIILGLMYKTFFTPHYFKMKTPVTFQVNKGESFSEITNRLYTLGIIPGKTGFKIAGFLYGAERRIRPARFYIQNGLSYLDLIDYFINGEADYLKPVILFAGSSTKFYAERLRNEINIDSVAFLRAVRNKKLLDSLGVNEASFEGYLLPQEYNFYDHSSPTEVISIMYTAFHNYVNDSIKLKTNLTENELHRVIIMASIVNGETNKKDEMPRIAGVYYNRLKIGMKLQADPTIQYLQPNGAKRLSFEDLRIKSPYNTYMYGGLPPGPIDNPGKSAIMAAVFPEKHDYLYFVADGKGGHKFSRSYSEHLKNVEEYRNRIR
jgi:UPF0755 protein